MPVRMPARRTISGSYSANQLRGGQVLSSNGGIAFEGARLKIDMHDVRGAGLLAGEYSETVEISLVPRL
jgi:hypothetical protein